MNEFETEMKPRFNQVLMTLIQLKQNGLSGARTICKLSKTTPTKNCYNMELAGKYYKTFFEVIVYNWDQHIPRPDHSK